MKWVWREEIHKCTRKRHKNSNKHQPHNFPKKMSNWNTGGKISTVCLHFAFSTYCRNKLFCCTHVALHPLHLQNPKPFVEGNQQSSCQQKSKCDGPGASTQAKYWLWNSSNLTSLWKLTATFCCKVSHWDLISNWSHMSEKRGIVVSA